MDSVQASLNDNSTRHTQPIAVVGMAFRFPGDHSDEQAFWQALMQQHDLVTSVPPERWATAELQHPQRPEPGRSITYSAGVLSRIESFDAGFFGISPREAAWLDPQQRLLLELTWETLENAGIPPVQLAGSDCAVYVGISGLDYGTRGLDDLASLSAHTMTGNTLSVAANRLSYILDLHGPSLAVDTACSSSLVALHHACNSLRNGEASTALVGGVNLLLHPYPFVGFTKASMLSAGGRCKPFDASGDGYVRSEGGAVLLLKPLAQAQADGDTIHAVIRATGVNADGARKTGITIPSADGQIELMRQVLERSGLRSADIDFIEAHGTGTAVGDPIETAAIGAVYGQGREQPLPISSVKANLGHMEPASGMAGFVKAVLALKNQALPPTLHLKNPNPHIDFTGLNLRLVQDDALPLAAKPQQVLRAGVNSFGFGGANAHVLLEQAPASQEATTPATAPGAAELPPLLLSARSPQALQALAQAYADLLSEQPQRYYDIAYGAAWQRQVLEQRFLLAPTSVDDAITSLRSFAQGQTSAPAPWVTEEAVAGSQGDIALVYAGNGAQWAGMGQALLQASPAFAQHIARLDSAMQARAGFSILAELQATPEQSRLNDTAVAQPLLFAMQVAITQMLQAQGLQPTVVLGHSVGEIAAAWASGALSLEQAIDVICARSQAQNLTRGNGRMAAAALSVEAAQQAIAALGARVDIEIAGINSPGNVTLSGSLADLQRLQEALAPQKTFFRVLDLDYAFHSHHMDAARTDLAQRLQGLRPQGEAQATFISTVTGDVLAGDALNADYWWRNVRQPVRFADAVAQAAQQGCRVFIEVSPHAILQRYIKECLAPEQVQASILPTLQRGNDGPQRMAETALRALLYTAPKSLRPHFPQPGQRLRLPNYPWQRERHWQPTTSESLQALQRRRVHPLLGWAVPDALLTWENVLDAPILPWLADHQVGGAIVFPGAGYAEMALAAARQWQGGSVCTLQELDIIAPLVFDGEHARSLRLVLQARDGSFQIFSRQRLSSDAWTLHAAGRLLQSVQRQPQAQIAALAADEPAAQSLSQAEHYQLASQLGLDYGPIFQGLQQAQVKGELLQASLQLPAALSGAGYVLHPAVLDVCFQSLVDFFAEPIRAGQGIALLPVKIGRLEVRNSSTPVAYFRACLRRRSSRSVLADFELFSAEHQLLAIAQGCRFRAAHLKQQQQQGVEHWHITPWLQPHPAAPTPANSLSVADWAVWLPTSLADAQAQRQRWHTETLPLMEALALSFAYQACQQQQERQGDGWQQSLQAQPYGHWLQQLLHSQELLDANGQLLPQAELPPATALWQTLLRDAPACLPQLSLIGSAGVALGEGLLQTSPDGAQESANHALQQLHQQLAHSPIAESIYHTDPAYLGTRRMLQALLQRLAQERPAQQRLRVLELSAGLSELPHSLSQTLPAQSYSYVLAHADEDRATRQAADFQEHSSIHLASYSLTDASLSPLRPATSAADALPTQYDCIIVQHSLHRLTNRTAALAQWQQLLAPGGLLVVAERHADWSADLVQGLAPDWWQTQAEGGIGSSLLPPAAWQALLADAGWQAPTVVEEEAAQGLGQGAYLLLAQAPASEASPAVEAAQAAHWLLVADAASHPQAQALQQALQAQGHSASLEISEGDIPLALGTSPAAQHIVWLQGWQDDAQAMLATSSRLLQCVQHSASANPAPRLWLITHKGLQSATQSALWGLGRVVMNECPQLHLCLIDWADDWTDADWQPALLRELLQADGSNEILLNAQGRHVPMLLPLKLQAPPSAQTTHNEQAGRFKLDFLVPGQLRNLQWLPLPAALELPPDAVEVRTQATGLNFRDVMYLMGLLPDEAVEKGFAGASLGLEFSGIVSRTGSAVTHLQVGDAVMGFGSSCFASHIVTRADAVAPMPAGWAFEAAATVPTVFLTVYYALKQLADLQPGERVLIHGAAGGVGIAAIQLARHLGAEVFATAGSPEKRRFVQLLGADHVLDSRSLEFADEVLALTQGEGVDVVLNSLAGEAMRRSMEILKPFGRFLELGKRDFFENTPIGLRPLKDNISYFGIDADQLLTGRPQLAARLFAEVIALFRAEVLAPLPYRSFGAEQVVDAFRLMQQSRHIGKIVLSLGDSSTAPFVASTLPEHTASGCQPACQLSGEHTWLVTGGLSGFGQASARWLVQQGVRHLALVGRRGADTPGGALWLQELAAQGVQAQAFACDIGDAAAVQTLVQQSLPSTGLPTLTGVLHAAAQFDDQLLHKLDTASLQNVLRTKLVGAWNLHQATLGLPLTHFVLYSSVTTAIGNPGQANYVAANMGLEGLAAQRRSMGLPATCMGWGPIADAGYLVRNEEVKDALAQRLGKPPIAAQEALGQLPKVWAAKEQHDGHVITANFDWPVLARLLPSAATGARFAQLNWQHRDASSSQDDTDIHALLQGKTPAQAATLIQDMVVQQVASILCIAPERIAPQASLHDMGMDSLMAVELALGLEQRFGIQLPVMMLNDSPSVLKVSNKIADQLLGSQDADEENQPAAVGDNAATEQLVSSVVAQHGAGLSEQEIADLSATAAELAASGTRFTP